MICSYRSDPLTVGYDRIRQRHSKALFDLLSPLLPERSRILDVGVGHGHFLKEAEARDMVVDGIEPADAFREGLIDRFHVSPEAVPPIAREDSTYDLVNASMLIENLPTSREATEFVSEVHRVLRPGGILCLIFPDYMAWGRFFFDEHYTHSFVTTEQRVRHLLTSHELEVISAEHVLGWFWVTNSPTKIIVRHLTNIFMAPLHTRLAFWIFRYGRLGGLHWKLRKTFFEAVIMIARRTEG